MLNITPHRESRGETGAVPFDPDLVPQLTDEDYEALRDDCKSPHKKRKAEEKMKRVLRLATAAKKAAQENKR